MDNRLEHKKNYIVPIQEGAFFKLKKNYDDKDETILFKYIEKKQLTHDTYIMRFEIPNNMILGLEIGTHLAIKEKINDEEKATKRKYTPTSWNFEKGFFDLLLKIYHPSSTFPMGGKMTQFLHKLSLNTQVSFLGPLGKCIYYGDGEFKITNKKTKISKTKTYKHICMVAGGTGITPFYQVNIFFNASILMAADKFKDQAYFYLIFGNKTENDILLRDELDTLLRSQNFNFKLYYTLDHVSENWDQGRGYVSKDMISSVFPKPGDDVLNLLCGPSAMCKKMVIPILIEMGYNQDNIFKF